MVHYMYKLSKRMIYFATTHCSDRIKLTQKTKARSMPQYSLLQCLKAK